MRVSERCGNGVIIVLIFRDVATEVYEDFITESLGFAVSL